MSKVQVHVGTPRHIQEGLASNEANPLIFLAPRPGLEPGTYGLTVRLPRPSGHRALAEKVFCDNGLETIFQLGTCPES